MSSKKQKFYGWKLAVIVGLVYLCSGDAVLPTAQIVNPLMLQDQSMQMNGTILGLGFSLFVLMQGIPGPLIGQLIAKKGARFAMILGSVIMIVGSIAMITLVKTPIAYLLFFGVILSVGSIMAGLLSVQTTVGNWFVVKRGRAMTLTMCIAGLGAIIVPFLVSNLVKFFGGAWQSGWFFVMAMAIILLPLAIFLVKNTPAEIGQNPDGITPDSAQDQATIAQKNSSRVYKNTETVRFSQALRKAAFWLIALLGTGGFVAYTLAISQGVIHFTSLGLDHDLIVTAVMSMGFASLVGRFAIGLQSDRFEPARLMAVSLLIIAVGILLAAFVYHPAIAFAYYLLTGFGFGAVSTLLPTTIANYFGAGEFSKNLGATMLVTTLFASLIPIIGGAVFDTTGSCVPAFIITAIIVISCSLCGVLIRIPVQDSNDCKTDVSLVETSTR